MIIMPSNTASAKLVTYKGAAINSYGVTSMTLPAHSPGDLILIYATSGYGNQYEYPIPAADSTVPNWVNIYNITAGQSGTGASGMRVCYAIATSSSHTSGDWGSYAGMMGAIVYSGANATNPIGAKQTNYIEYATTTTYITAPSITLQNSSGSSAVASFGMVATFQGVIGLESTANYPTPSGYTERAAYRAYSGYGDGHLIVTKDSSASSTAGGVNIGKRGSGSSYARTGAVTIEVLA